MASSRDNHRMTIANAIGDASQSSYTLFAFRTFFGRGLQAKWEGRNEGKYLKIGEVEIEW